MRRPRSTRDLLAGGGPSKVLTLKSAGRSYSGPVTYTNDEAPGAWPNGTRVRKRASDSTDAHQDGAAAVVVGSIGPAPPVGYGYFVEWDDSPGIPTFIAEDRLTLEKH